MSVATRCTGCIITDVNILPVRRGRDQGRYNLSLNSLVMKGIYREARKDADDTLIFILDEKIDLPELGPNDIRVQIKACGLSVPSNKVLNELFAKTPRLQFAVGHEVAGVVAEVGPAVSHVQKGDKVTGVLPLDAECSGCAEYCLMSEYDVVKMPSSVNFIEAAALVGDGLRVYTALHYQARVCGGDTVLILDAASAFGTLCVQVALQWGAKVICTVSTQDEKVYLEEAFPSIAQILDLNSSDKILLSTIMEETGGTGVDAVIDNGVEMFASVDDRKIAKNVSIFPRPTKHEIVSALGVGARWITTQCDLQLDPPDSTQLFLRSASVCFLFEHTWTLSTSQHGRYQHILTDLLDKVSNGTIKPHVTKTVSLENAVDVLQTLHQHRIGKAVAAM